MGFAGRRWHGSLTIKMAAALAVVALGDALVFGMEHFGGWFGAIGLTLCAALALSRPAVRQDRRALIVLGLAGFYAAAFARDPSPLAFLLFWIALGLATLLPGTARFGDGWQWFQRLLVHGFKALFGPLTDFLRLSRVRRKRGAGGPSLRRSLPNLVLPVVGSVLILLLFAAANPVIDQAIKALHLPEPSENTFARIFFASALFVMAWGVLRPRPPRFLLSTFDGRGDMAIPGVTLASVTLSLVLFNGLFALQNVLDSAFLWGGVKLPGDMTLADYAHRGAYPLLVTALLAAGFVLVALRPGSQTARNPLVRRLVMAWIGQNLFLVGSAALRTWDYVQSYDLTRLRIAALLWMALVAIGLVLVLYRMLRNKSAAWLINANLASAGALLFALCFVDTGTIAARWNLAHAREFDGTGAGLDWCYLEELRGSALLPLAEMELREAGGPLGDDAASLRWRLQRQLEQDRTSGGWTLLNNRRLTQVHTQLGPRADQPQPYRELCNRYVD